MRLEGFTVQTILKNAIDKCEKEYFKTVEIKDFKARNKILNRDRYIVTYEHKKIQKDIDTYSIWALRKNITYVY